MEPLGEIVVAVAVLAAFACLFRFRPYLRDAPPIVIAAPAPRWLRPLQVAIVLGVMVFFVSLGADQLLAIGFLGAAVAAVVTERVVARLAAKRARHS